MTNAVKKKEETNIVTFDTSVFEEDAGKGLTNLGSEDLSIPFLRILSDTNDEVKKRSPKYIEGAEVGMMFNTLTRELYSGEEGVQVIPCAYQPQLIEWSDRGKGTGAPVNIHPVSSNILSKTTRDDNNKDRLPNGNYIEYTANHYVLILSKDGTTSQALVAMKSTQRKKSKRWNSLMLGLKLQGKNGFFNPPTFSHIYKLTTVPESNDQGQWFGWDINRVGPVEKQEIYAQGKIFQESVDKGEVKVKHEDETTVSENAPY
tara:strand:- start:2012 stop:2791 length:780 start_codon:yes stop_codon:yes gene_type:complete